MKEYTKIETLYRRDEQTKKLVIGQYHNETVEYLKNNQWVFTEKVDGTNIRVHWDGHAVSFAGRTDNAQLPPHLFVYLTTTFGGEANAQLFEQKFGSSQVTLYGEGYGVKIQNGGLYRDDVALVLFDVEIDDLFLRRDGIEDVAKYFCIEIVPIVFEGTLDEGVSFLRSHKLSTIAKRGASLEGIVGKPKMELLDRRGNRVIVKIKHKDFE